MQNILKKEITVTCLFLDYVFFLPWSTKPSVSLEIVIIKGLLCLLFQKRLVFITKVVSKYSCKKKKKKKKKGIGLIQDGHQ